MVGALSEETNRPAPVLQYVLSVLWQREHAAVIKTFPFVSVKWKDTLHSIIIMCKTSNEEKSQNS